MPNLVPLMADSSELLAAREQMAFTLGFHIILACFGVGFPAMMLIANYIGLRRKDPVALELAQRWSKVAAVTFAVGAVTGTVLSFEFGLLWPEFTRALRRGLRGAVHDRGDLLLPRGDLPRPSTSSAGSGCAGWEHFWTGVPIVICGIGGAFSVVAVNSWMNQPQGFTLGARRGRHRRRPARR